MPDQLVPYYDPTNNQFLAPDNNPHASWDVIQCIQLAAAAATIPLGIAARPGTIKAVRAAAQTAITGNATYTVDVKKNGTSVLTGTFNLDNSVAARVSKLGTLDATKVAFVAGDFFEAVITKATNTGSDPANMVIQADVLFR